MTKTARLGATVGTVMAIVVLAYAGQRLSPPMLAPVGDSHKKACNVDAPDVLKPVAKKWCADGLFARAEITGDDKDVISVMQFTPNGAQTWELQSGLLMGEFLGLTDQMAAAAPGKSISVALHDPAGRRVGACARATTDTAATCGTK
jgi:hypothetical protein